ncbi:MAG: aminotransferase class I/II-fold pyridoxal phosphate-dependent enzyme [bacterium]|nr:aminotransferase class I/II-fold pyridoxal phosphate-dependent enzyme [bacterium]
MQSDNESSPRQTRPQTTRRGFFTTSAAAALSFVYLPGKGRVQAEPFARNRAEDYDGRLCYNENPLGPSPAALLAMQDACTLGHRYPDWFSSGLESRIAAHHGVSADQVCAGAGATELIHLIASALLGAGDEVITAYPSYSQIESEALARGASVVQVPLDMSHVVDLDAIAAAISPATRMIYLVNPNNPVARIIAKSDLETFISSLPSEIILVVDEAYHDFVHSTDYETCLRYVNEASSVIVVRTFSKAYGLAGVRVGYSIASSDLTDLIASQQPFAMVSRPSQAAAEAALDDQTHVADTVALNDQAKALLEAGFTGMGIEYIPSETNFMMFDTGTNANSVKNDLNAKGFQVRTGWGMPQHIRVSTGTVEETNGFLGALESILAVGVSAPVIPAFALVSTYPNPFNGRCSIRIDIPDREPTRLILYDLKGRRVRTLINGRLDPGRHDLIWDGRDHQGHAVASGTYVVNLTQGEFATSRKIMLLK